ncbi:MAG: hypothetical protein ACPIOQ_52935, partial [Promethearchaeia archaeon]
TCPRGAANVVARTRDTRALLVGRGGERVLFKRETDTRPPMCVWQGNFVEKTQPRHGNFVQRTQPNREPPKRPVWAVCGLCVGAVADRREEELKIHVY